MTSERKQILEMLAAGKISADEADRLIQLTADMTNGAPSADNAAIVTTKVRAPRFIRIVVEPNDEASSNQPVHHVNVRVPLKIIRAGVGLASLIPNEAGHMVRDSLLEKGYKSDFSKLDSSAIDELIEALQELSIDATVDNHDVKIFVE